MKKQTRYLIFAVIVAGVGIFGVSKIPFGEEILSYTSSELGLDLGEAESEVVASASPVAIESTLIENGTGASAGGEVVSGEIPASLAGKNVEAVLVTRVVDGDTVELESGEKVRYIGINTPETVAPGKGVECYGKNASEKNVELVEGKVVYLEMDVSDEDRYDRLLRYVYLADGQMVNELLVAEGYANASSYPPDVKYQDLFAAAEAAARAAGVGLWSSECGE